MKVNVTVSPSLYDRLFASRLSTTRLTLARVDAAMTPIAVTSASMIVSAEAVAAVRREFRDALRTASLPVTGKGRRKGAPSQRTTGCAMGAAMTIDPISNRPAARPTFLAADPPEPESDKKPTANPAAQKTTPMIVRSRKERGGVVRSARMAATGDTRE